LFPAILGDVGLRPQKQNWDNKLKKSSSLSPQRGDKKISDHFARGLDK
jgi:hypothetical protein